MAADLQINHQNSQAGKAKCVLGFKICLILNEDYISIISVIILGVFVMKHIRSLSLFIIASTLVAAGPSKFNKSNSVNNQGVNTMVAFERPRVALATADSSTVGSFLKFIYPMNPGTKFDLAVLLPLQQRDIGLMFQTPVGYPLFGQWMENLLFNLYPHVGLGYGRLAGTSGFLTDVGFQYPLSQDTSLSFGVMASTSRLANYGKPTNAAVYASLQLALSYFKIPWLGR